MKQFKSTVMLSALVAMAISAQAGTFTVSGEGILGTVKTTVDNPAGNIDAKESAHGFGIGGKYAFGDGYDVSIGAKNISGTDRKLMMGRADAAKTFAFGDFGSLRVSPLGVEYVRLSNDYNDGTTSKDYNVYYSPSLTYSKDIAYGIFAQIGGTYNRGLVSHYSGSGGFNETLPKSNGYEGVAKVGYNITSSMSATLAYNIGKYDYAGDSIHYNTIAKTNYAALGLSYSF